MNYKKHYNLLIDRAKLRKLDGYFEKHHIIPKCMGGSDDVDNIVKLNAREHFVAHQLLYKIYKLPQLYYSISMMVNSIGKRNNRLYEWHRKNISKYMKDF